MAAQGLKGSASPPEDRPIFGSSNRRDFMAMAGIGSLTPAASTYAKVVS